jgi:hypothetical protein
MKGRAAAYITDHPDDFRPGGPAIRVFGESARREATTAFASLSSKEMKNCPELRAELDRLTTPSDGAGPTWLSEQVAAIAALRAKYDHTIDVFEPASQEVNGNGWVNCFMYALGIDASRVNDVCLGETFPNSTFVTYLIGNLLMQKNVRASESSDGDIAIYFDDTGKPTHAALRREGRFISKWGGRCVLAHVWSHGVYEVPGNYGNDIRIFEPVSKEDATRAYRDWAAPNGLTGEEEE